MQIAKIKSNIPLYCCVVTLLQMFDMIHGEYKHQGLIEHTVSAIHTPEIIKQQILMKGVI